MNKLYVINIKYSIMKKITIFLFIMFAITLKSQTVRYFEFTTNCGHGNWQDTSFIAATSDQVVIDTVLANISRPLDERKFISGKITYGNGGHNHNANHWFLWHFIPNQWDLVELSIEICDGCPYTDVDANITYWIEVIGQFCPWSGRPVREISDPSLKIEYPTLENNIHIYPNPTKNLLFLKWNSNNEIFITLFNSIGEELFSETLSRQRNAIDLSKLENGLYILKITDGSKIKIEKIIVDNNLIFKLIK